MGLLWAHLNEDWGNVCQQFSLTAALRGLIVYLCNNLGQGTAPSNPVLVIFRSPSRPVPVSTSDWTPDASLHFFHYTNKGKGFPFRTMKADVQLHSVLMSSLE